MGRIVVLAEKPSVGRDIARILGCNARGDGYLEGGGYLVTWAVGHLVTLVEPDELDERYKKWRTADLPILPDDIPLKVIQSSKDQFNIVRRIINDDQTDRLICATDAGREGELIFRYIYDKAGCKKPFDRLWINSMTDAAIKEGFDKLKPGSAYDHLYESARCRSVADWLVGMNASRAFTLRYDVLLSVGRVQTPTLSLLVKRRKEIDSFKPEDFALLTADFGDYKGMWFKEGQENDTRIMPPENAKPIAARVKGQTGTVISAETTRKRDLSPQLYDLTSLQRDANQLLGFTADKTLKLAQDLYEKHKALTYPRTDSRYLPPDMIPRVVETMKNLPDSYQGYVPAALPGGKLPVTKRTVDAEKVSDHHALIPTNRRVDPSRFSEDERQLYDMVARRMLAAFYPACEYDATKVITQVGEDTFRTNGRVVLNNGWRDLPPLANPPKVRKKKAEDDEDAPLPALAQGDTRTVQDAKVKVQKTKPPQEHNDASLLYGMEHAGREVEDEEISRQMAGSGIGTPATRAAIIERLIQVGYAKRDKKNIIATPKGVQLISIMPDELASPATTGRWEQALDKIAKGKQDPDQFLSGIRRLTTFLTDYARTNTNQAAFPEEQRRGSKKGNSARPANDDANAIEGLVCPVCGKGKVKETDKAFGCTRWRDGCHFTLWKDTLMRGGGPELNEKLIRLILEKKRVIGSTGAILLDNGRLYFYPTGASQPAVSRELVYQK